MWKDVYEGFSGLTKMEQAALFDAMKRGLFPEEPKQNHKTTQNHS